MSYNALKSFGHGFCDAIFSKSPIDFDKENRGNQNKEETPAPTMLEKSHEKIEEEQKSMKRPARKLLMDYDNTDNIKYTGKSSSKSTHQETLHTRNTNMVQKTNSAVNLLTDDKTKTPMKVGSASAVSSDKSLDMHFCTPKNVRVRSSANTAKMNLLSSSRTPTKRYFTDNVLCKATPDCFNPVHVETPQAKINDVILADQTVLEGESSNLTVGIRVRPLNARELCDPKIKSIIEVNGQNITVDCETAQHTFMYDHCFISYPDSSTPGHANQETIFTTMVLPLVQSVFEGYNVCLFAYGQTGSGKSYSMMGQEYSQINSVSPDEASGIIPRFCQELFTQSSKNTNMKTMIEISYFEIYNEKIHDLLTNTIGTAKRAPLKVREHPAFGPYIVDLSQHCVQSYKDLQSWLKVGNSQRATAATGMNEKSSRSHSIFSIIVTQSHVDSNLRDKTQDTSRRSKINLVDLAGSERLSQTCASGDRLKEGVSINKSLLTLGKVIASLAENTNNRKRGFVPYRESVLTWLLKESLGGNSRTAMLGTVSPVNIYMEETLATLRYACQARAIVNRIHINEDPHEKLIRQLKAEVLRLRGVREGYEKQLGIIPRRLLDSIEPVAESKDEIKQKQQEIDELKDQLKKMEEQLTATQMTWLKKLQETEERKNSELKYLRRCGIAIELDFHEKDKQPCLVNLAADPMLSGALLYLIPPGLVRVGKDSGSHPASKDLDIILDGPLVRPLHCSIENTDGELVLSPEMDGDTYVNGQIITGKVILKHGDRLVIGGNHYFKVSNPCDTQSNIQISAQAVDFDFAHQEILRVQEGNLRAELEECKQKAIKELESAKREVELQMGSQKLSYERKIELLGSTVEEQKHALEEIEQRKRELELEKEVLVTEVEANNRLKQMELEQVKITPYKSNFLQDLESILNETTADAEFALKMKASTDAIKSGGITLHEMQLLVKEATERCREVGLNYEFYQQQTIINKRLKPVVRIRNRELMKETLWQPLRFLEWVHRIRDYDIEDSIKELCATDSIWETFEDTEIFEDSLNTSRISINMTPVKKQLNESLQQLSVDNSLIGGAFVDSTVDIIKPQNSIDNCLAQMEFAMKSLHNLTRHHKQAHKVSTALNKVEDILIHLRNTLDINNESTLENDSANSMQSFNDTVIEKSSAIDSTASSTAVESAVLVINASPVKPTLRTTPTKFNNIQKNVRFTNKSK